MAFLVGAMIKVWAHSNISTRAVLHAFLGSSRKKGADELTASISVLPA